ncbi:hypothetical protein O9992_05815 [Vibrio lentus]|nr:hypothetical protein [Vibrio lentus]
MKYGYFDNDNREYVITALDVPAPWTNYLGTGVLYRDFAQCGRLLVLAGFSGIQPCY